MSSRAPSPKVYWCSGSSGREDALERFVVAACARDARRFFASNVGCKEDDVATLLVFIVGDADAAGVAEGWPCARFLERCGVRFWRMRFGMEFVEFGGRIYRAPSVAYTSDAAGGSRRSAADLVH